MVKVTKRRGKMLDELVELRAQRRKDIIKCAFALLVILVVVLGQQMLMMQGIIEPGNIAVGAVSMGIAIGLCIFAGSASIDFTKSGHRIDAIMAQSGFTKKDVKDYEKSK